jgi:hypothetical protein
VKPVLAVEICGEDESLVVLLSKATETSSRGPFGRVNATPVQYWSCAKGQKESPTSEMLQEIEQKGLRRLDASGFTL